MAITWGSAGVFGTIGKAIKEANADSATPASILSAAKSFITAYITYNFRIVGQLAYQSFSDLYWEGIVARMLVDSQSVNANTVSAGSIDQSACTGSLRIQSALGVEGSVTPTQMLVDDDTMRLTCVSARAGADSWQVDSVRSGRISGVCQTGTLYGTELSDSDKCGLSFTILEPQSSVAGDVGGIIGNPTASTVLGGVKGTNCDSDGVVWIDVVNDGYGNYTMSGYPTSADLVAQTNRVFHVTYTTIGSKTIVADNASGLSGTITISVLAEDSQLEMTLKIAYAVGDIVLIGVSSVTDGGVIQTFFRDNYSKVLPSSVSPTIADSLAQ